MNWKSICGLLLGCLLVSWGQQGQAQTRVYAGIGFNQSFTSVDSLNWVIDRYNETHLTDRALGPINAPRGLAVSLGATFGRFLLDLSYTGRQQTRVARETVVGTGEFYNERHLRYRASTFDVGVGWVLTTGDWGNLALGTSLDFGSVRMYTRYGRNDQVDAQPFNNPFVNELTLGNTWFVQGMFHISPGYNGLAVLVRPYFQLDLYQNDYGPVNRVLNPATYQADPLFVLAPSHNFGLKAILVFQGG